MRTVRALLLFLIAAAAVFACTASDGSDAGSGYVFEEGTLTVTAPEFDPVEDEEWNDVRSGTVKAVLSEGVVSVSADAFSGFSGLRQLDISVSVTTIGQRAFSGTGLVSLDVPDSVVTIGERAFADCLSLTSVSIGQGLRYAGADVFSGCGSLEELHYGCAKLRTGGTAVFNGAGSYRMKVVFGGNVNFVPGQMFMGSNAYEAVFATSPVSLGDRAFSGSKLSIIDMSSVSSAGTGAFAGTHLIKVNVPAETGSGAFAACASLREADVSALQDIPDGLFMGCSNLEKVTFSDSMKRIGDRAFCGTAVTDITFPWGFTYLGKDAFSGCTMGDVVFLTDLSYAGTDCIPSGADIVLQDVKDFGKYPFGEPRSVTTPCEPKDGLFHPGTRFLSVSDAVTYVVKDSVTVLPFGTDFPEDMIPDRERFSGWYADGAISEPAKGVTLTAVWDTGLPVPEPPPEEFDKGWIVLAAASAAAVIGIAAFLLTRRQ